MNLQSEINTFFNLSLDMMEDKLRELNFESESDEIEAIFIRLFDKISTLEISVSRELQKQCLDALVRFAPQLENAVKNNPEAAYRGLCFCVAAGWLSLHPVLAVSGEELLVGVWMYREYRPMEQILTADEIKVEANDEGGLLLAVSANALMESADCVLALSKGCDLIRNAEWGMDVFWDIQWQDLAFTDEAGDRIDLSDYILAEEERHREQNLFYQNYKQYGKQMKSPHLLLHKAVCGIDRYQEILNGNLLSLLPEQTEKMETIEKENLAEFFHQALHDEKNVLVIADKDRQSAFCSEYQTLFSNLNFLNSSNMNDIETLKATELEIRNREAQAEDPRFQFQKRRFEELKKRLSQSELLLASQTEAGMTVGEIWNYLEDNPCKWNDWPKKLNAQQKEMILALCSQWEAGMLLDSRKHMLKNMLVLNESEAEKLAEMLGELGNHADYIVRSKNSFLQSVGIEYTALQGTDNEQLNLLFRLICLYDAFREVDLCRKEPEKPDEMKKLQLSRYHAFAKYQEICDCFAVYHISEEKAQRWLLENQALIEKCPYIFDGKQPVSILGNPTHALLDAKICELAGYRRGGLKDQLKQLAYALYEYKMRKAAVLEIEEEEKNRFLVIWEKMGKKGSVEDADIFSAWYRLAKEYLRCMKQKELSPSARELADALIKNRIESEQDFSQEELEIFAAAENLFDSMEAARELKECILVLLGITPEQWNLRMQDISYLECFSDWNIRFNQENLYQLYQKNKMELNTYGFESICAFWEGNPYSMDEIRYHVNRSYLQYVFESACEEVHLNLSLYQSTKKSYEAIHLQLIASRERELNNRLLLSKQKLYEENPQLFDTVFSAENAEALFLNAKQKLRSMYPIVVLDKDSAQVLFSKIICQKEAAEIAFDHLLLYQTEDRACYEFLYPLLIAEHWNAAV